MNSSVSYRYSPSLFLQLTYTNFGLDFLHDFAVDEAPDRDEITLCVETIHLASIFFELGILPAQLITFYLIDDAFTRMAFEPFYSGCKNVFNLEGIELTICANAFLVLEMLALSLGSISGLYSINLYSLNSLFYLTASNLWFKRLW